MALILPRFETAARNLILHNYCRIHGGIDFEAFAAKLDMPLADVEREVVGLIRGSKLEATVDNDNTMALINGNNPPLYKTILDKTRIISARSNHVLESLTQSVK
eukprot:GHVO01066769.1.p1 GENE.GHVO01066769.1~~GHVO01066769.1.p1  ORF type:complete len:119 (+),score=15.11 GHVO01066769.1:46-357(+)